MRAVFAARAPGPYVVAVGLSDAAFGPVLDARSVLAADDVSGARLPIAIVGVSGDVVTAQQQRAQRIATEARWSRYLLWAVLGAIVWDGLDAWPCRFNCGRYYACCG